MAKILKMEFSLFIITILQFFIIIKLKKMSAQLDALKATILEVEAQEQRAIDEMGKLITALTAATTSATDLQTKLDQAIADLAAAGSDTAALDAINTDLAAHSATLKAAVDAAPVF